MPCPSSSCPFNLYYRQKRCRRPGTCKDYPVRGKVPELKQWQATWVKKCVEQKTASRICALRLTMGTPLFSTLMPFQLRDFASYYVTRWMAGRSDCRKTALYCVSLLYFVTRSEFFCRSKGNLKNFHFSVIFYVPMRKGCRIVLIKSSCSWVIFHHGLSSKIRTKEESAGKTQPRTLHLILCVFIEENYAIVRIGVNKCFLHWKMTLVWAINVHRTQWALLQAPYWGSIKEGLIYAEVCRQWLNMTYSVNVGAADQHFSMSSPPNGGCVVVGDPCGPDQHFAESGITFLFPVKGETTSN